MCERRVVLQFADESTLRRYCEQCDIAVLDARYDDAVTLTLKMKAGQAEMFKRQATDLLRGALAIHRGDAA